LAFAVEGSSFLLQLEAKRARLAQAASREILLIIAVRCNRDIEVPKLRVQRYASSKAFAIPSCSDFAFLGYLSIVSSGAALSLLPTSSEAKGALLRVSPNIIRTAVLYTGARSLSHIRGSLTAIPHDADWYPSGA